MSSLSDGIGKITILEILVILLALIGVTIFFDIFGYSIGEGWIYVVIILYFIYRLRIFGDGFKEDLRNIFSKISPKSLLIIVLVNVFFSYGMLYLSNFALTYIPGFRDLLFTPLFSIMAFSSFGVFGGLISIIFISPICEELLFRGVFLNKLKIIVPTSFAIIITSILFGALHGYGSIISAFVFGVCMCILYLKTNNILTCILAHFLNNLLAEFLVHIDTGNLIFTNGIFMVIFSVLAILSLYLIIMSIRQEWKYVTK